LKPAGHKGETRDQRLEEFIQLNPGLPVVGLPEGTALILENGILQLIGLVPGFLFSAGAGENRMVKKEIKIEEDLSFLL
jgi:dipeptidase E